jgi:hypothetical protein
MKTKLTWLFWLVVIGGGAAWYLTHYFLAQARERRAVEIQQQQTAASIAALAFKYNAVTNWAVALTNRDSSDLFSIEVSRALIRSDRLPVLVKCDLIDIGEDGGQIIASFSVLEMSIFNLSLDLQCSPDQLKHLTGTKRYTRFATIVRCDQVRRGSSEDSEGFSFKGELLDAVQLP